MAIAAPQIAAWIMAGGVAAGAVAVATGVIDITPYLPWTPPASEVVVETTESEKSTELAAIPKTDQTNKPDTKPAAANLAPSFDIMRVEKNGSVLIAGNATPNSNVEIVIDGETVSTTKAGANGDFVAVLENPLAAGDHEVSLQSQSGTEAKVASVETGLVSIPKEKSGELLAMVTKPGEPSRVLQKPEMKKPEGVAEAPEPKVAEAKVAEPTVEEPKPVEPKAVEIENAPEKPAKSEMEVAEAPATEPAEGVTKSEEKVVAKTGEAEKSSEGTLAKVEEPATAEEPAKSEEPAMPVEQAKPVETAKVEPAEGAESGQTELKIAENKPAIAKGEEPTPATGKTEAENTTDVTAGEVKPAVPVEPEPKTAEAPKTVEPSAPKAAVEQPKAPEVAVAKEPDAKSAVEQAEEKPIHVAVEAVEVEGTKVFVAGAVEPYARIFIYIDGEFVGSEVGTPNGRFVVEAERTIAPGNHNIRADVLKKGSVSVVARAEVPFIHEPETVVAAAKPEPKVEAAPAKPVKAPEPAKTEEVADVETSKVVETTTPEVAEAPKPVEPTVKEESAAVETPKPAEEPQAVVKAETKAAEERPAVPMVEEEAPAKSVEVAKVEEQPKAVEPEPTTIQAPKLVPAPKVVAQPKSTEVTKVAKAPEPAIKPLRTGTSVIIRRGDSLWRISRRTYGRGIRYSTIYTANLDQVRNPHRIWPGQILRVPKSNQTGTDG